MAKIVIIGGGSYNWTPSLTRDMFVRPELAGSELWLVDINPSALSELEKYCKTLLEYTKADFTLHTTTDRKDALTNADFVIITISTGGLNAMRHDLEIPYKYDIYQPVGDTVGPGGISRALRNIPVFIDLAKDFQKYCPNAWILNITNPMTVLTQVLAEQGCKVIGLCHELYALWGLLKEHFNCDWEDINLSVAGLNHFAFILSAYYKDIDCFDVFKEWANDPKQKPLPADVDLTHKETHGGHIFKFEFFRRTGRMMYPGDRHTSEFFHNVLTKHTNYGAKYGIKLTKIEDRFNSLEKSKQRVKEWIENPETIELKPSREAVSSIISAMITSTPLIEVVNLPNVGQIENLPRGVVVETMATISSGNLTPHTAGPLPDDILTLIHHHAVRFNMIIESARKGDKKLALEALASDPMVNNWDTAEKLLDELLLANKQYLPQFQ